MTGAEFAGVEPGSKAELLVEMMADPTMLIGLGGSLPLLGTVFRGMGKGRQGARATRAAEEAARGGRTYASAVGSISEGQQILQNRLYGIRGVGLTPEGKRLRRLDDLRQNIQIHGIGAPVTEAMAPERAAFDILQSIQEPLMSVQAMDPVSQRVRAQRGLEQVPLTSGAAGLNLEGDIGSIENVIDRALAEHITEKVVGYGPGGLAKGLRGAEDPLRTPGQVVHNMVQENLRRMSAGDDTTSAAWKHAEQASDIPTGTELKHLAEEIKRRRSPSIGQGLETITEGLRYPEAGHLVQTHIMRNPRTGRRWLRPSSQHGGALDIAIHHERGPRTAITNRQAQDIVLLSAMGMSDEAVQQATRVPSSSRHLEKQISLKDIRGIKDEYADQIHELEPMVKPNPELEAEISNTEMFFDRERGDWVYPPELEEKIRANAIQTGFHGTPQELVERLEEIKGMEQRRIKSPTEPAYDPERTLGQADKFRKNLGEGVFEGEIYQAETRRGVLGADDIVTPKKDGRLRKLYEDGVLGVTEDGVYYERGTTGEILAHVKGKALEGEAREAHKGHGQWVSGQPVPVETWKANPEAMIQVKAEAGDKGAYLFKDTKTGEDIWIKDVARDVGTGRQASPAGGLLLELANIIKRGQVPDEATRQAFAARLDKLNSTPTRFVDLVSREEAWTLAPKVDRSFVDPTNVNETIRQRKRLRIEVDPIPPYHETRPPFRDIPVDLGPEAPRGTKTTSFDHVLEAMEQELFREIGNGDLHDLENLKQSLNNKSHPGFMHSGVVPAKKGEQGAYKVKETGEWVKVGSNAYRDAVAGKVPEQVWKDYWSKVENQGILFANAKDETGRTYKAVTEGYTAAQERLEDLAKLHNRVREKMNQKIATLTSESEKVATKTKGAVVHPPGSGQRTATILESMSAKVDKADQLQLDKLDEVEMSILSDVMELEAPDSLANAYTSATASLQSLKKLDEAYPAWASSSMGASSVYEVSIMAGSKEALGRAQRTTALTKTRAMDIIDKMKGHPFPAAIEESLQWMSAEDLKTLSQTAFDVDAGGVKLLVDQHIASSHAGGILWSGGRKTKGKRAKWSGPDPDTLGSIGFSTHSAGEGKPATLFVDKADAYTAVDASRPLIGDYTPQDIVAFRVIKEALDTKAGEIVFSSASEKTAWEIGDRTVTLPERVAELLGTSADELDRPRVASHTNMPPAFSDRNPGLGKMGEAKVQWRNNHRWTAFDDPNMAGGPKPGIVQVSSDAFNQVLDEVFAAMARENSEVAKLHPSLGAERVASVGAEKDPILRLIAQHGALNEGADQASEGVILGLHSLLRNGLEAKIDITNRLNQAEAALTRGEFSPGRMEVLRKSKAPVDQERFAQLSNAKREAEAHVKELKNEAAALGSRFSDEIVIHQPTEVVVSGEQRAVQRTPFVQAEEAAADIKRRERVHDLTGAESERIVGGTERYVVARPPGEEARQQLAVTGDVVGKELDSFKAAFKAQYTTLSDAMEAARSIGIDVDRMHVDYRNADDIAEMIYRPEFRDNAELLLKPADVVTESEIAAEFGIAEARLAEWQDEVARGEVTGFLHQDASEGLGQAVWKEGDVFRLENSDAQKYVVTKVYDIKHGSKEAFDSLIRTGAVPPHIQTFSEWAIELGREGKAVQEGNRHVVFRRLQDPPDEVLTLGGQPATYQDLTPISRTGLKGKFRSHLLPGQARDIRAPRTTGIALSQDPQTLAEQAARRHAATVEAESAIETLRVREEAGLGPEVFDIDVQGSRGQLQATGGDTGYGGVHDPDDLEHVQEAYTPGLDEELAYAADEERLLMESMPEPDDWDDSFQIEQAGAEKRAAEEAMYGPESDPELLEFMQITDLAVAEKIRDDGIYAGLSREEVNAKLVEYFNQPGRTLDEAQARQAAQMTLESAKEGAAHTGASVEDYLVNIGYEPAVPGAEIRDVPTSQRPIAGSTPLLPEERLPPARATINPRELRTNTGPGTAAIRQREIDEALGQYFMGGEQRLPAGMVSPDDPIRYGLWEDVAGGKPRDAVQEVGSQRTSPPVREHYPGDIEIPLAGSADRPVPPEYGQTLGMLPGDHPKRLPGEHGGPYRAEHWDTKTPRKRWLYTQMAIRAEAIKMDPTKMETIRQAALTGDKALENQYKKMKQLIRYVDDWIEKGMFTANEVEAIKAMAATLAGSPSTKPTKVISMTPDAKKAASSIWNKAGAVLIAAGMIRSQTKQYEVAA